MREHPESVRWRMSQISERFEQFYPLLEQERWAEARALITESLWNLRELKREMANEKRLIRDDATQARLKTSEYGQSEGNKYGGLHGSQVRGILGRTRAAQQRVIAQNLADLLAEYTPLENIASDLISIMEHDGKLLSDSERNAAEVSRLWQLAETAPPAVVRPPAPQASPSPPPPQWAPDPSHSHELRWWDGLRWTEHVVDHGTQLVDPLR